MAHKKILFVFFAIFYTYILIGQKKKETNRCQEKLSVEMYDFFTETISNKYNIKNESQLYKIFIHDFVQQLNKKLNKRRYYLIKLQVSKKKLNEINKILFIRDTCHYYYFYKDRVVFTEKLKWEKAISIQEKHLEIPIALSLQHKVNNKNLIPYENTYNILLNLNSGFFSNREIKETKLASILTDMSNTLGENISLSLFATAINNQKNANIFINKNERMVIAIAFWKVLCVNTNTGHDFHRLPDNVKEIFGI